MRGRSSDILAKPPCSRLSDYTPRVRPEGGRSAGTRRRATRPGICAEHYAREECEANAEIATTHDSGTSLQGDLARTETALDQRTSALLAAQVRIHELEQARPDFPEEPEKQRTSAGLAEEHLCAAEKTDAAGE